MCEVEFGELPSTPSEKKESEGLAWAMCVADKAAQRPGEWCMVLRMEQACDSTSPQCKEFDHKRDSLYHLLIRYRYNFDIAQKLGVTGSTAGEMWIRHPRGFFQSIKETFLKKKT
jgi:hypothetical protein